nr:MAG TPA: hypothetical protein [Caudoviricetes sp.]DAL92073.1 MAG TPA: hypothetical protein [Caudoviricetes sp.]DAO28005.1 MAG TPA: hypothetical protein [Caudoviricetes sp.]
MYIFARATIRIFYLRTKNTKRIFKLFKGDPT